MKKLITFFFVLVLMSSLALAVDVTIPKTDFTHEETVVFSVTNCVGVSTVRFFDPQPELIDVDQGNNDFQTSYATASNPSNGKYSAIIMCADGTTKTTEFCVDANGCLAVVALQQCNNGATNPPACNACPAGKHLEVDVCVADAVAPPAPAGNGGGGGGCLPQWSCGVWSYCNSTLKEARTCTETNRCNRKDRQEIQACTKCDESWICSSWSGCQNGMQTRACSDEHACKNPTSKPILTKGCNTADYGSSDERIIEVPPEQFIQTYPVVQKPASIWETYRSWFMGIFLLLLVLVIVIITIVHYWKPKKKAYNFDELRQWIVDERKMGTSDSDIRQILVQETGWREDEIKEAFRELRTTPTETVSSSA